MYTVTIYSLKIFSQKEDVIIREVSDAVCIKPKELIIRCDLPLAAVYYKDKKLDVLANYDIVYILSMKEAKPLEIINSPFSIDRKEYCYPTFKSNRTDIRDNKLLTYCGIPAGYLKYLCDNDGIWVLNIYMLFGGVAVTLNSGLPTGTVIEKIEGIPDNLHFNEISRALFKQKIKINGKVVPPQPPPGSSRYYRLGEWILYQYVNLRMLNEYGCILCYDIEGQPDDLKLNGRTIIFADDKPISSFEQVEEAKTLTIMKYNVFFIQKTIPNPIKDVKIEILNGSNG